jgi:RNA polymerase sigma-70 factor (ECF subfamily)
MEIPQRIPGAGSMAGFHTTHWSMVLAATNGASPRTEEALGEFCSTYWYPLYAFIRRRGYPAEEAEDLTQEFFARLCDKQLLGTLSPAKGKFRSYLLTTLKFFLANEWHRGQAQKRGGGKIILPIDEMTESRYQAELVEKDTPERLFDRQWAWTVLDRVLERIRKEHVAGGKAALFERLRGCLPGADNHHDYATIAAELQMTESSVRMAVYRMRQRYGYLLREEIATTVSTEEEIDEELNHLIEVLGS